MRHEKMDPATSKALFDGEAAQPRYTLAAALLIVRRIETSASRGAVFAEITNKNPLYRLVDRLYGLAGKSTIQPLLLLFYMLKCVTSLGPFDGRAATAVSITNFANEDHTIDRFAAMLPGVGIMRLSLRRAHMFSRGQLSAALRLISAAPRIWPFLVRLAHVHSFMPSARIASALAFYMRFGRLFDDQGELKAAVVASNYSPEAVGLAAAAHNAGRKVVYLNHAPVPANSAVVPQVIADCAAFYGDAIRKTYESRSRCTAEVVLIGQPGDTSPMEWRDDIGRVGIFLTALTRADAIESLVKSIRTSHPNVKILIRNHPVALLKTNLSALASRYGDIDITIGTPLDDEIAACDMVFCGNSGVTMNVLRGGRPVAYSEKLDGLAFDYNGFVETGLACHAPEWKSGLYGELRDFYSSATWRAVMQSYDASYGADQATLERAAAVRIASYLS